MTAPARIQEILVPTDLSSASDPAFEHGRLLAESFDARLTVYHAVHVPDHRFPHWTFAQEEDVWDRAETNAREILCKRVRGLPRARVLVEKSRSIHSSIVDLIRKSQADLTVMATHGRHGIAHLLLGSVTEKVIQRVFRPVLCLREAEHGAGFPYHRILVPTDLSLASRLAFPLAAGFARAFGAELVAVHVIPAPPPQAMLSGVSAPGPVVIPSEAHLWKFLQPELEGLPLDARVVRGTVWDRIVHVARVEKVDLIVMSTHGHDSLADHVLGSNTERVVRHAPCPVLVA